ncbi:MAG TPA: hypothetical protein VGY54_13195 [Polyangiaceae bacterium]|nr:hypothetical protein [Polyangiaceae bacterium]
MGGTSGAGGPVLEAGQPEGMAAVATGVLPNGSGAPAMPDIDSASAMPDGSGITAMQDGSGMPTGRDSQANVGTDVDAAGACSSQFCETFEEYPSAGASPDPATWTLDGSPVVIDSIRPHRGTMSLHVPPHNGATCTDGAATCPAARFIRLTGKFPASLHKQFYGRVFFYIEQQATGAFYHWGVMEAGAGTTYSGGLAVRMGGHIEAGGAEYLRFHLDTHMHQVMPFETGLSDTQAVIKPKTWYCLEWYYDAPGNEAKFWLDGNERPMLHWKGPMAGQPQFSFPPEFKSVAFGWRVYQNSTKPFEVFVDDIALDAQKIGCN